MKCKQSTPRRAAFALESVGFNPKWRSWLTATLFGLLLAPGWAGAQSFSLDRVLPSAIASQPFLQQIVTVLAIVILAAVFITLGFGMLSAIGDVFSALGEARQRGEWAQFMKNLGMVIGVVVVGVVLAALVYTWITTIQINPTVTIGGS